MNKLFSYLSDIVPSNSEYFTPNLFTYPKISTNPTLTQFTEGDLHANTMRLIQSLVHYDVIDISEKDYQNLLSLYQCVLWSDDEANNKKLVKLIKAIGVKNKSFLVRLIGDTLADRTGNDLFTLTLMDHLLENNCKLRILISNHDIYFLTAVMGVSCIAELKYRAETEEFFSLNKQGRSFLRLVQSVERGELSFSELKRMVNRYFSTLLLLDYAESIDHQLEIFSHAPINFDTLKMLGTQFKVAFPGSNSSNQKIIEFIDEINKVFRAYVQCSDPDILRHIFEEASGGTPACKVIWQRERDHKFMDASLPIVNIYGHDKSLAVHHAKVVRLDNKQGKGDLSVTDEPSSYATNSSVSLIPHISHKNIQSALQVFKDTEREQLKIANDYELKRLREVVIARRSQILDWFHKGFLTKDEVEKHRKNLVSRTTLIIKAQVKAWDEFDQAYDEYAGIKYKNIPPAEVSLATASKSELRRVLSKFFHIKSISAVHLINRLMANELAGEEELRNLIKSLDEPKINEFTVILQKMPIDVVGKVVTELQKRQQELQAEKEAAMKREQELQIEEKAHTHSVISSKSLFAVAKSTPVLATLKVEKLLSTSDFDAAIESKKAEHSDYPALEGRNLCKKLDLRRKEFLATGRADKFVDNCSRDLRASRSKLAHNSGWVQFIMDILSALIFIASCTLSYWVTGRLRLFLVEVNDSQNYDGDNVARI